MRQSRTILLIVVSLLMTWEASSYAQIKITSDNAPAAYKSYTLRFNVADQKTQQPLPYASAYLQVDTLITHFALANEAGEVVLRDIQKGKYSLNVELLGYKSFRQQFDPSYDASISTILLEEDHEMIDAATITDLSTPVKFLRDTVIYNASAFKTGNNAMLEDLLKKMPGLSIENGVVYSDGKPVSEITVEGRTFFFGDPSMALRNLPARIVEKIVVTDRTSAAAGGVNLALGEKSEKAMDVVLKEEFKRGSFGQVLSSGGLGALVEADTRDTGKGLWNGKLNFNSYDDNSQITTYLAGSNVVPGKGLGGKAAMNVGTNLIRGLETTLSVISAYNQKDEGSTGRMTYLDRGNSRSDYSQNKQEASKAWRVDTDLETRLTSAKNVDFTLKANAYYSRNRFERMREMIPLVLDGAHSSLAETGQNGSLTTGLSGQFTWRSSKKENRSLKINQQFTFIHDRGDEMQQSSLLLDLSSEKRTYRIVASAAYSEPLSDKWTFSTTLDLNYDSISDSVAASDHASKKPNIPFSSDLSTSNMDLAETLLLSYKLGKYRISAGGQARQFYARIGEGNRPDWRWGVVPYIHIDDEDYSKQFYIWSQTNRVLETETLSALLRTSPNEIHIGNQYLKPSYSINGVASYEVARKTWRLQVMAEFRYDLSPIVQANWVSKDGTRYSFPVNAKLPGINVTPFLTFDYYFGERRNWNLYANLYGTISAVRGFQSSREQTIDIFNFEYRQFLDDIWGNDSTGSRFYAGESGFENSTNRIFDLQAELSLSYRNENITASGHFQPKYFQSAHSLIPEANYQRWIIVAGVSFEAILPQDFTIETALDRVVYSGYGPEFDRRFWDCSLQIGKDIGMFSLSLKCNDLFNKSISLSSFSTPYLYQYELVNRLGRTCLISVSYQFGKGSNGAMRKSNRFLQKVQ